MKLQERRVSVGRNARGRVAGTREIINETDGTNFRLQCTCTGQQIFIENGNRVTEHFAKSSMHLHLHLVAIPSSSNTNTEMHWFFLNAGRNDSNSQ